VALMFRNELTAYVKAVLTDSSTERRGYFDPAAVRMLIDQHVSGQEDHHTALWRLVVLEEWHRQFIDSAPVHRPLPPTPVQIPARAAGSLTA
jgi:asparagine synthase (glutamine-hydrolysing)